MPSKKLTGIFPPIITAFTESGDFYEKGQKEIIEFLLARGVHGLFAIGSYGSFALMSVEERKHLTRMILKIVRPEIFKMQ